MLAIKKGVTPIAQPMPLTFDAMPALMQTMYQKVISVSEDLLALRMQQPINELPIDSKELMVRLAISEPTVIRMRKRGDIPFLEVCGNYRYLWPEVLLALASKKKGAKVLTTKNAR